MGEATVRTVDGRTAPPPPNEDRGSDSPTQHTRWSRLRTPRRPRLWFEIALIALSYWTYSLIRNAVPEQRTAALRNADGLWHAEHLLGIAVERSVNHAVDSVSWLIVPMNYYYATFHFVLTIGVLVWLYRWHPGRYTAARTVLFVTTVAALLGYYFYPLAPPRLMPGAGFVDTVVAHHTWGSMASGNLAEMSNQYAAMPSMHIGWSVWCGVSIVALAGPLWAKVLGALYPCATLVVIVATANHFWLDAVGGLLCLALGFALSRLWYGALPYRLPRTPLVGTGPPGMPAPEVTPGTTGGLDHIPDPTVAPDAVSRPEPHRPATPPDRRGAPDDGDPDAACPGSRGDISPLDVARPVARVPDPSASHDSHQTGPR